jgi:hypothetical protein
MPDVRISEWLEGQAARNLDRQRATVENSKLMATFIAAVAATIVVTALQVGRPGWWDFLAAVSLAWCLGATWRVIEADRLTVADHDAIMTSGTAQGLGVDDMLHDLRQGTIAAVNSNETVVEYVRSALWRVLIAAALASALALISLLRVFLLALVGK